MTDEATFRTQILDNPADDATRLVYADWLDEHGTAKRRARAEFIRLQCELAKLPGHPPGAAELLLPPEEYSRLIRRAIELRGREQALLKKWGAAWVPRIGRVGVERTFYASGAEVSMGGLGMWWTFRFARGFVDAAALELVGAVGLDSLARNGLVDPFIGHPVGRLTLGVLNHAPCVAICVRPLAGLDRWELLAQTCETRESSEADGEDVFGAIFESRAELVQRMPGLVATALGEIDFEAVTDYADYEVPADFGEGPNEHDFYGDDFEP